jgi:hypothetical protein
MRILEYSLTLLDLADDCRRVFSILLVGNQIAESARSRVRSVGSIPKMQITRIWMLCCGACKFA